jgi:hypothetical protein
MITLMVVILSVDKKTAWRGVDLTSYSPRRIGWAFITIYDSHFLASNAWLSSPCCRLQARVFQQIAKLPV